MVDFIVLIILLTGAIGVPAFLMVRRQKPTQDAVVRRSYAIPVTPTPGYYKQPRHDDNTPVVAVTTYDNSYDSSYSESSSSHDCSVSSCDSSSSFSAD